MKKNINSMNETTNKLSNEQKYGGNLKKYNDKLQKYGDKLQKTPCAVWMNRRLPAEWQKKQAVWLAWKENPESFFTLKSGKFGSNNESGKSKQQWLSQRNTTFASARREFFAFLSLLLCDLPVRLLMSKKDFLTIEALYKKKELPEAEILFGNKKIQAKKLIQDKNLLSQHSKHPLYVFFNELDDIWLRDSGPLFFSDGTAVVCRFNGWGAKYAHKKDAKVGMFVAQNELALQEQHKKMDNRAAAMAEKKNSVSLVHKGYQISSVVKNLIVHSNFICEGGAVESNGSSAILVTRSVCGSASRGCLAAEESKGMIKKLFGLRAVMLCGGLTGDDTGGHVDNVARFSKKGLLLLKAEKNAEDEEANTLRRNVGVVKNELRRVKRIRLRRIPPSLRPLGAEGMSHLNFFIGAGAVFVPCFITQPAVYYGNVTILGAFYTTICSAVKAFFTLPWQVFSDPGERHIFKGMAARKRIKELRKKLEDPIISSLGEDGFLDIINSLSSSERKQLEKIEIENLQVIVKSFPHMLVRSVSWRAGIFGGGGLHCLSQPVMGQPVMRELAAKAVKAAKVAQVDCFSEANSVKVGGTQVKIGGTQNKKKSEKKIENKSEKKSENKNRTKNELKSGKKNPAKNRVKSGKKELVLGRV